MQDADPAPTMREPVPDTRVLRIEREVHRFGKTTRWFHWSFALSFLCLAATGALLALRRSLGSPPETGARLLAIHQAAAVCLVVLPAWVLLSGRTRELAGDLRELFRWSREDLRWLALQPLSFVRAIALPPAGKLNAGQKLNGIAMGLLTLGLVGSGAWLWREPGALLPLAVHVGCFLAWLPLFAGHLMLALVLPGTRPALRGMVSGRVRRDWAVHHHLRWIAEIGAGEPSRDAE
jgi:formate dehydrogenase subunit gamma